MFKNLLIVAARNLVRSKGYSFINVMGLAIGMTCCTIILLFVQDEFRYDAFHENGERIYRVTSELGESSGGLHVALTQVPLAAALKKDFPEIIAASVFSQGGDVVQFGEKSFVEQFNLVEPDFFTMFTWGFLHGDPETVLSDPHSVVLTESAAEKFFGKDNPLGQTLEIKDRGGLTVTGVIKDTRHSHIDLNLILSKQFLKEYGIDLENWDTLNYSTYVMLTKDSDWRQVEKKIKAHVEKYESDSETTLHLQPLSEIYLYSDYAYDIRAKTSDATLVYILLVVAVFVLAIACINFMNLTTARSEKRIRETGMRKVLGAKRTQLILQFMGEAAFLAFTALGLTVLMVYLVLPFCNELFQKELSFEPLSHPEIGLGLLALTILTGLLSGIYPAILFSRSQPSQALQRTLAGGTGTGRLRKILVVAQFSCSIILIISTLGVYKQLRHFQSTKLGYKKEHLVTIRNRDIANNYAAFKNQIMENPAILAVTASTNIPTWSWPGTSINEWEGNEAEKEFMINRLQVNYEYFETYGMEIVSGRSFAKDFQTDAAEAVIVNEEAVKQMELVEPLGKQLSMSDVKGRIIGVVRDFHFDNLRNRIKPLMIRLDPEETGYITIRIDPADIVGTMDFLKETGESFAIDFPVNFQFLDTTLQKLYQLEKTTGEAALYFSVLAISIASLGLFGLASFSTERRTKEIGVRKVLGATVPNIIILLSKEFTKLVVVAFLIASPLAYFGLEQWLQSFANRIEIGFGSFLLTGFLVLGITYLTVGYQSIKAALTNPTEALHYE